MSPLHSGWSVRFLDDGNDGWKDLLIAQGHDLHTASHPGASRKVYVFHFAYIDGDGARRGWCGIRIPAEDSQQSHSLRRTEEFISTGSRKAPARQTGSA